MSTQTLLVARPLVLGVHVLPEAFLAKHDGGCRLAAHGESVTHDTPLRLSVESHHLAQVVDEADQVEPVLVRVLLSDPLRCLESVDDVGQVKVGVALVNKIVEHLLNKYLVQSISEELIYDYNSSLVDSCQTYQSLHDGGLHVVKFQPLLVLLLDELYGLIGVHLIVSPPDPLSDYIIFGVVTESFLLL